MPREGRRRRRRRSESREIVGLKEDEESVHEGGLPFDRSHFVTERRAELVRGD